jgi:hypothetical protein
MISTGAATSSQDHGMHEGKAQLIDTDVAGIALANRNTSEKNPECYELISGDRMHFIQILTLG